MNLAYTVGAGTDATPCEVCARNDTGLPMDQLEPDHICRKCDGYEYWVARGRPAHTLAEAYNLSPPPPLAARSRQVGGDHYKEMGVEPWDVIDTWPVEQQIGAYRHGALKYLMRAGSKGAREQDIAKAHHYLEKLLEVLRAHDR